MTKFNIFTGVLVLLAIFATATIPNNAKAAPCGGPSELSSIRVMGVWLPDPLEGAERAALQGGFYKNEGLEVELMSPTKQADALKLLSGGKLDIAVTYVADIMQARAAGVPVVSIAAILHKLPLGLMVRGDSGINSVADLKGKVLGVSTYGLALAGLKSLLGTAGLTEDDVQIVDPGWGAIELLIAEKIDAGYALEMAEAVFASEALVEMGRPPVKFFAYRDNGVPNFYYLVYAADETWLKNNPNTACRFLRATKRGQESYIKNPDPVIEEVAGLNDIFTPEQHRSLALASMADWMASDGTVFNQDIGVWRGAQEWAISQELLSEKVDPSTYFTNDYIPE